MRSSWSYPILLTLLALCTGPARGADNPEAPAEAATPKIERLIGTPVPARGSKPAPKPVVPVRVKAEPVTVPVFAADSLGILISPSPIKPGAGGKAKAATPPKASTPAPASAEKKPRFAAGDQLKDASSADR